MKTCKSDRMRFYSFSSRLMFTAFLMVYRQTSLKKYLCNKETLFKEKSIKSSRNLLYHKTQSCSTSFYSCQQHNKTKITSKNYFTFIKALRKLVIIFNH